MKPVIVLAMGINGLGTARGLGREGVVVYGVDKVDSIGFSSKYIKKRCLFSDPETAQEECLNQFINFGKSISEKAVLLPTNDPYVAFISKYRNELSQYFSFNIPEE